MTNRREFLQAATVLSIAPLAGRAAFAFGGGALALDAVIFDLRHPEARDFGARAGLLGAPLREIDGDITDLWQHELLSRWKDRPAASLGLTERPALFLLERLAWDHGLRVVYTAEHAPDGQGRTTHLVTRTSDTELALELEIAGHSWPSVLADSLIAGGHATTRDFRPTNTALAAYPGEGTKLYSWIIAPRTAV